MGAGAARRARAWLLSLRTLTVKALLFDFDGVLWDSEAAAFQSWQETYGEYAALHRLGIRADEAVAIEDSPNGIRAAKAARVFCLGFANDVTRQLDLSRADVVVDSLDDLPLKDLLLLAAS